MHKTTTKQLIIVRSREVYTAIYSAVLSVTNFEEKSVTAQCVKNKQKHMKHHHQQLNFLSWFESARLNLFNAFKLLTHFFCFEWYYVRLWLIF